MTLSWLLCTHRSCWWTAVCNNIRLRKIVALTNSCRSQKVRLEQKFEECIQRRGIIWSGNLKSPGKLDVTDSLYFVLELFGIFIARRLCLRNFTFMSERCNSVDLQDFRYFRSLENWPMALIDSQGRTSYLCCMTLNLDGTVIEL